MVNKKNKFEKKNKKTYKVKKIISNFALIVFLILMFIAIYNIIEWYKSSKQTNRIIKDVSNKIDVIEIEKEDDIKYEVDFESLKNTNSDVVAWLRVNGTKIDYPVVKGTNNDFYLTHSLDRKYNIAGWIFADYRNKFNGLDKNIIIYGHNMKDGTMFNTLKDVIKPEWYKNVENHKVILVTEEGEFEYQVFATYQIKEKYYDTTTNFKSNEQYIKYIETAKKRSIYNYNVEITNEDEILTLSTCADNNKYRIILQAKKVK